MHFKVLELVLDRIVVMSTTIISQESDARAYRFWVERHNALQHFLGCVRIVLSCQRDCEIFTTFREGPPTRMAFSLFIEHACQLSAKSITDSGLVR